MIPDSLETPYLRASYIKRASALLAPILLLLSFLITIGCSSNNKKNESYYKDIFREVNTRVERNDIASAEYYMDSALCANPPLPEFPYYAFQKYAHKAEWHYLKGRTDSNGIYLDSSVQIMDAYKFSETYPSDYANVLNSMGDHYFQVSNFPKAFEFFSRSRIASLDINDTCAYSNQTYHLGMVTYRQEKYAESIKYFKEAFKETGTCVSQEFSYFRKEELLANIGLANTQLQEFDSAISYYNDALVFTDTARKRLNPALVNHFAQMARGVILGNLAKVYIAQGRLDTAEQLLTESISINSRAGYDTVDAMYATMQLAELYHKWNKQPQMVATLQQISTLLAHIPSNEVQLRWEYLMYKYKKEKYEPTEALQYLEKYLDLRKAIDLSSKKLKQTDYVQLLKNQEAQYQIKFLRKKRELDRVYLFIALGLSSLTVVIIILIYIYYRRSRKNVKLLTLLNHRIKDQKEQLEATMEQLRQSNTNKDRILHVVAHDLRNPINAIQSLINLIQMDDVNEEQREMLGMMDHASDNSLLLINEILEFSGNNTGQTAGDKKRLEINELARQAVGILQFKADEKKQTLTLKLSDEPLYITAYEGKTGRVLGNLISNAIKFSAENREIIISVTQKDKNVVIEVKDSGIGIPESYKSKIFDTFTDAKRLGTAGEPSFGLGLSICKQIVEACGGKIWFESTEGKGTGFFVELPLTP